MAMMDNAEFLIRHIRNSFITSDDTGMCEVILEAELLDKQNSASSLGGGESGGEDMDTELPHSYDILADMAFDGHRRRSNTAQRLDKLKREKQKQSKIKHIQWKEAKMPVEEMGEYFEKKEISRPEPVKKSVLSVQLEKKSTVPNNPFMAYAKFDGRSSGGVPTKKIQIFLTMADASDRPYPMTVVTLATAKVQDLIGLICWQYFVENRTPPLPTQLEALSLNIAEDDGEVDMEFPALDNKEPISKFGFSKLALVQKEVPVTDSPSGTHITVDLQHRGVHNMVYEDDGVAMKTILDDILQKYDLKQRPGLEYGLEKRDEPGELVDMNLPLHAANTQQFFLIRENSARGCSEEDVSPTSMTEMARSLSSMRYQSFVVSMLHKLRSNKEVQLGVSGDKIEIDPLSAKGLFRQKAKPVTIDMEDVAVCTLMENKHHGKCSFRLVHQLNHEFRNQDFECETTVAQEIVTKINNILEMRSSPVRKDYQALRERKLTKKLSFS